MNAIHTFYFKGDLAKYTGETEELHGQTWLEAELLEGHREGELILVHRHQLHHPLGNESKVTT